MMTARSIQSFVSAATIVLAAAGFLGCAGEPRTPFATDLYPTTYRPLPRNDTFITGATILDGADRRLEHASVFLRDGKVAAIGIDLQPPAGALVIDARGRWITPGIVDIHSHAGDFAAPYTAQFSQSSDANEATEPNTAHVWAELPSAIDACSHKQAQIRAPAGSLAEICSQIVKLRQVQDAQIAEIRRYTDERIVALEAAIAQIVHSRFLSSEETAPSLSAEGQTPAVALPKLDISGDLRLRYEGTSADEAAPARDRGVLRARISGRYDAAKWLSLGARLATGDPDDPNSTDVTLSDFADDLTVSLDQAYARFHYGTFEVDGGKIPLPFTHTELVWDSDVNPDGVSASWARPLSWGGVASLAGIYFTVNEMAAGPDSGMAGLQLALSDAKWRRWSWQLATGYYNYELEGLAGADSGDTRSNLLMPDGTDFLSDFNLLDIVARASYATASPALPVRFVANYVKNLGAATSADTGFSLEMALGRASEARDLRFSYGYSMAETDAVLAAFSHDNTTLGTNYRQHAFGVDYLLPNKAMLNGTLYRYRLNDAGVSGSEWLERIRLNFLVEF